jgi:putative acetyltransferase
MTRTPARFTIRLASFAERPTLIDIWRRAVIDSHRFLQVEDIRDLTPAVVDYLSLPELQLWLLCDGTNTPVGFMGLQDATVDSLFIAPEHWRQGGGTLLIDHARHLRGPLTVDVNEQNTEALDFYRALGFAVIGRSPVDSGGRPFPLLHLRQRAVGKTLREEDARMT